MSRVSMTQIDENALFFETEVVLKGREDFINVDRKHKERIYCGSIFADILEEHNTGAITLGWKSLTQIRVLAELIDTDYVKIVKP